MKQRVKCPKCYHQFEIDGKPKKPRLVIKYNIDKFKEYFEGG